MQKYFEYVRTFSTQQCDLSYSRNELTEQRRNLFKFLIINISQFIQDHFESCLLRM